MDFQLTEEQAEIRTLLVRFAQRYLNESEELQNPSFSMDKWKKCAQMNVPALPFPERYGGCGLDLLTTVIALEAMSSACTDNGLVDALIVQICCGLLIERFGTGDQKDRYLAAICSGDKIFAQALPVTGRDAEVPALHTLPAEDQLDCLLEGREPFVPNGPIADFFLIADSAGNGPGNGDGSSCYIVGRGAIGSRGPLEIRKMGLATLPVGRLALKGCTVTAEQRIGRSGQGAEMLAESREYGQLLYSAACIGRLERIQSLCARYARERRQFGRPIQSYQSVANKIVDMKVGVELGRLSLYRAAWLKDRGLSAEMESSITWLYASEGLRNGCLEAVQIHGAYGYMQESGIEREFRDSVTTSTHFSAARIRKSLLSLILER